MHPTWEERRTTLLASDGSFAAGTNLYGKSHMCLRTAFLAVPLHRGPGR